jgi:hypothetical protein
MKEVRKVLPKKVVQSSWYHIYRGLSLGPNQSGEFHIPKCEQFPDGLHYHGNASCSWEIKAHGWEDALRILEERKVADEQ